MGKALLLALVIVAPALGAQQQDTVVRRSGQASPLITRREAAWGLVGTAVGIGTMFADTEIRDWVRSDDVQSAGRDDFSDQIKRVNEKSLFVAELALWGIGRLTKSEALADASWHAAEAVAITTFSTTMVRVALGRTRPFKTGGDDAFDYHPFKGAGDQAYRAVPSLHAAAAFATAAAVTGEVHRRRPGMTKVVAPVSFALASLPGLGRVYADKHWTSDVVLGAVWGTITGIATVRWHHEHDDRLDRWMLGPRNAPNGQMGLGLSRQF